MKPRQRMTILLNARSTRCPDDMEPLLHPLRKGFDVRTIRVSDPSTFSDQIRREAGHADVLVLGCGDGTMARSGGALLEAGLPVGLIPFGNANDLARGLGLPLDPGQACEALAESRVTRIDIGRVNGHYFFNAATFGIGAEISAQMDAATKRKWKRLSQIPRLISAINARRPFKVEIELEGKRLRHRSVHVTVANGRTIGGGIVVDKAARLDDHNLNFSSVRPQTALELLALAPAFVSGRRDAHPRVDTVDARRMRIETSRPLAIATDGDIVTETPADFETFPAALSFLIPESPAESLALDPDPGSLN